MSKRKIYDSEYIEPIEEEKWKVLSFSALEIVYNENWMLKREKQKKEEEEALKQRMIKSMSNKVKKQIRLKKQKLKNITDVEEYAEELADYVEYCIDKCHTVEDLNYLIYITNNEK